MSRSDSPDLHELGSPSFENRSLAELMVSSRFIVRLDILITFFSLAEHSPHESAITCTATAGSPASETARTKPPVSIFAVRLEAVASSSGVPVVPAATTTITTADECCSDSTDSSAANLQSNQPSSTAAKLAPASASVKRERIVGARCKVPPFVGRFVRCQLHMERSSATALSSIHHVLAKSVLGRNPVGHQRANFDADSQTFWTDPH